MAKTKGMVKFNTLGNVPVYWARVNAAYGNLAKTTSQTEKGRMRELIPTFKKKLDACVAEIYWLTYGHLGPMQALVSGGAWVPESEKRGPNDRHVRGIAIDLGGFHWKGHADNRAEYAHLGRVLSMIDLAKEYHSGNDLPDDYPLYLALEAVFRRHFGTVLGIHHNQHHWNHFHIDTGTRVGFWTKGFGAKTRIVFLQAVLKAIWGKYDGKIDGDYGPKTKAAEKAIQEELGLGPFENKDGTAWSQFLLLTAMVGLQMYLEPGG